MPGWSTRCHLLLLNSLTCGLEICVAAGITYVPPLLLEAGVEERYMTMVLGIGPILGLLLTPLIGSASDRCTCSLGRRRPFICTLSLGVLLSLFMIPHASALAAPLGQEGRPLQVGLLVAGVALLDFCGQVCFTPLEALLSDLYSEGEGCGQAFATFSFMVSLGGCVGYLLPTLDWTGGLLSRHLGGQDECLFGLLALVFVASVLLTLAVSEERPRHRVLPEAPTLDSAHCGVQPLCCRCPMPLGLGTLICVLQPCCTLTPAIYRGYQHVPRVIRRLCEAQLCSWTAVMSFMLFYTDFVGEGLYGGVPSAAPGTASRQRYDEGIRVGSLGLFLQCATSTIFSLAMSRLVRLFGSRRVYLGSMACFTASTLVICLSKNVLLVTAMSALTGFAYATLQTLPYTLTCQYRKDEEIYMPKTKTRNVHNHRVITMPKSAHVIIEDNDGCQDHKLGSANGCRCLGQDDHSQACSPMLDSVAPEDHGKRGAGLDFAILDSTFLLAQVFPTLFMGTIVQFTRSVTAYIASSTIMGIVAMYLANRIIFDQKDLRR